MLSGLPSNLDPRQKDMVDRLYEVERRKRSRKAWVIWLSVLAISLAILYGFNHGLISGWFGNWLAFAAIVGVILFLAFLSTKPFGRGDASFPWW